ncbi:MAG: response regulator transcription factor [Thalassovita sp.]
MRVLLIEDDDIISDAVQAHLRKGGIEIDVLSDCVDLTKDDVEADFDVVVLDLGLPGRNGLDFLKTVRNAGATVPILVFTALYAVTARVEALNLGADDYLTKPFDMNELMARCKALARRRDGVKPAVLHHRDLTLETGTCQAHLKGQLVDLTPKAFQLLRLLVENKGRVLTKSVIENRLYGWDAEAESNTVEVFISQIRKKIGPDYIKTLRGLGYLMHEDSQ